MVTAEVATAKDDRRDNQKKSWRTWMEMPPFIEHCYWRDPYTLATMAVLTAMK
jgi:hypothetical protein